MTNQLLPLDKHSIIEIGVLRQKQLLQAESGWEVFSGISDKTMLITSDDFLKLLLAVTVGGIIGLERESRAKSAGFRTITLITLGAALFTIVSLKFGDTRIAASIATGVGFLGAGVILREEGHVRGLTTASSIWVASALGMAIGYGEYVLAIIATAFVIIVLQLFGRLDQWIDQHIRIPRTYEITFADYSGKQEAVIGLFEQAGVRIKKIQRFKRGGQCTLELDTAARQINHERVTAKLLNDQDVVELRY